MSPRNLLAIALLAACGGSPKTPASTATAASACPPEITAAVTREHPDATQKSCKAEHEDGKDIFEAKLAMKDGSMMELELSPTGEILAVEEVVPASALPKAVADAFTARYPDSRPERVERVTPRGKAPTYEIAFGKHEVTFSDAGAFIEEEQGDGDKDDNEDKD